MRKLSKKKITEEYIFESEDGKAFPYEGLAIERDVQILIEELEPLKRGNINIPDLNLVGAMYQINSTDDLELVKKYCELKDFELKDPELPTKVIITKDFVVTTEELQKVVTEIDRL